MQARWWKTCGLSLAACLAALSGAMPAADSEAVRAAGPSGWYWQNPLPRDFQVSAIACRSATACVAAGFDGSIATTDDGGRHWTNRTSGIADGISYLACPGPTVCYALSSQVPYTGGAAQNVLFALLRSTDGGATWQTISPVRGATGQYVNDFTCPAPATCLLVVGNSSQTQAAPILRTADGGKTWQEEHPAGVEGISTILCPTATVCYAVGGTGAGSKLFRSDDSGKTWSGRGLASPKWLPAIACPGENSCFATTYTCNAGCWGIVRTTNGSKSWKKVAGNPTGHLLGALACPSVTTCYVLAASGSNAYNTAVAGTTNGGKNWSVHSLPDTASGLVCPSQAACYLNAGFGLLATQDGFRHTHETVARSSLHNLSLTDISCASATVCFAAGFRHVCDSIGGECDQIASPGAATANGGKTWTATPSPPELIARLSCPSEAVCYGVAGETGSTSFVERSGDGSRSWHRVFPASGLTASLTDITCPSVTTCYVTATYPGPGVQLVVLVTHDSGKSWVARRGIDTLAPGSAGTARPAGRRLASISCPNVSTCFVLAASFHPIASNPQSAPQSGATVALLVTRNGGTTWTRKSVPDIKAGDDSGDFNPPLACPTRTTCYVLRSNGNNFDPSSTGDVLVTHNGGTSWHRVVLQAGAILTGMACSTASACQVVGWGASFATEDGGKTWESERMAAGVPVPRLSSVACPAPGACYAVGGSSYAAVTIISTRAPG